MSINSDMFSRRFAPGWLLVGICLGLIGLIWIVFDQCRSFDFVNYDDRIFVTKNEHVLQGLSWENAQWSLMAGSGKTDADIDYWRPLSMMSHMLDVELFGLNAGAHHVMSVGLHALTAVTLFLVLLSMTGLMWRSAFIAAVFAVHPLHVESVAWVAERKDVLSKDVAPESNKKSSRNKEKSSEQQEEDDEADEGTERKPKKLKLSVTGHLTYALMSVRRIALLIIDCIIKHVLQRFLNINGIRMIFGELSD